MRRESSTVVVLVGAVDEALLANLGRSPNVSIARAPGAGPGQPGAEEPASARPGWEAGAMALREAARRVSAYVVVPDDPLADVAAAWRAMWDVGPLRAARPRRVAIAGIDGGPGQAARVLDALRSLGHGPWWPPLDELIGVARRFYAGGLTETQSAG